MEWINYEIGDSRTRRGFLFFPKLANKEWRWLVFASWQETLYEYGDETWVTGWFPDRWID